MRRVPSGALGRGKHCVCQRSRCSALSMEIGEWALPPAAPALASTCVLGLLVGVEADVARASCLVRSSIHAVVLLRPPSMLLLLHRH